jgi:hypothetical protein
MPQSSGSVEMDHNTPDDGVSYKRLLTLLAMGLVLAIVGNIAVLTVVPIISAAGNLSAIIVSIGALILVLRRRRAL